MPFKVQKNEIHPFCTSKGIFLKYFGQIICQESDPERYQVYFHFPKEPEYSLQGKRGAQASN